MNSVYTVLEHPTKEDFTATHPLENLALSSFEETLDPSGYTSGNPHSIGAQETYAGLAISLLPGSGGHYVVQRLNSTGGMPQVLFQGMEHLDLEDNLEPTFSDRILQIRHYLSLNVSTLAKALGIERPTVYAWLKGKTRPHPGNRARVNFLYEIAKDWRNLSGRPLGDLLDFQLSGGRSLLDLMTSPELETGLIRQGLRDLYRRAKIRNKSRPESIRAARERLGYSPVSEEFKQRARDSIITHVEISDEE